MLDHLVWAVPDLSAAVASFAERTGVQPAPGGRHDGLGTANQLLALTGALGAGAYLEIIGPSDEAPTARPARPFGIDDLREPRLVTWAARVEDIDGRAAAARAAGVEVGDVVTMSRATPDGTQLSWRLTLAEDPVEDGLIPFLIDWGVTPHPASRGLPAVELRGWYATHPDPERLRAMLTALGTRLDVRPGAPGLVAEIRGPSGSILLT
jgi:hypothetical protein